VRFIAGHADRVTVDGLRWGVESICAVLSEHGTPIAASTYYDVLKREPSRQALRDEELKVDIARVHHDNYGVYGAEGVAGIAPGRDRGGPLYGGAADAHARSARRSPRQHTAHDRPSLTRPRLAPLTWWAATSPRTGRMRPG
jgi:hypothetical protein